MGTRSRNKSKSAGADGNKPAGQQVLHASQATLLKPLGADFVAESLKNGRFRVAHYAQGNTIHFEGERCDRLELILSGQVAIERIDAEGNLMTVAQSVRNEVLGGNLVFSRQPFYPMTLTAVRESSLLQIERDELFALLSQNPGFLKVFLELASDRAFTLGDQIRHFVNKPIRACIIGFLQQEYGRQKTNPIRMSLSKKMLAEKMGVQRTSISRELTKMRRDGLITYDRDSVTILDRKLIET